MNKNNRLDEKFFTSRYHHFYSGKAKEYDGPDKKRHSGRKYIAGMPVTQDLDPESVFSRADAIISSTLKWKS